MSWAKFFAAVLVYDAWLIKRGRPTLTQQYQIALSDPRRRWLAWAGLIYLGLHLIGTWPRRADPLVIAANRFRGRV